MVKEAARAVSERDDRLLAEKMEALENANKEVCWCESLVWGISLQTALYNVSEIKYLK